MFLLKRAYVLVHFADVVQVHSFVFIEDWINDKINYDFQSLKKGIEAVTLLVDLIISYCLHIQQLKTKKGSFV